MKKGINKSILFYVVSALFLIASAIGLTTGNENTMAIIWLSLGSAFLCLGSTYKKKENNKTNTDGPTSIFIAGHSKKQPLKIRIKNSIYRYKRKKVEKTIVANPHYGCVFGAEWIC